MPFSRQTIDFLFENRLHDSKDWYQKHKDDYTHYLVEPFTTFVNNLKPTFEKIDSRIICTPKKISRLYRDSRYSHNESIFRDTVWCSFGHAKELYWGLPGFFFEFSPKHIRYGMGYYQASASSMAAVRKLILENSPAWQEAVDSFEQQDIYELCGEFYKKNRFPDADERSQNWLNRKTLCLIHETDDFDFLFSSDLSDIISAHFMTSEPVYYFLMKAEEMAGCDRNS